MHRWLIGVIVLAVGASVGHADELTDLKAKNKALESENAALKAQLDALTRRLAAVQGEKAQIDAKFGALSRRLASIENGIINMETALSKQLQQTIDRLAMLESGGVRPTRSNTFAKADDRNNQSTHNTTRPNTNYNPRTNHTPTKQTNNANTGTDTKSIARADTKRPPITLPDRTKTTDPVRPKRNDPVTKERDPIRPPVKPPITQPIVRPRVPRTRVTGDGLPTTIAVVDMVEVFNNLREKHTVEESLNDLVHAVKFQDKKWAEQVRSYQLDLELLEKGSLAYLNKQHQIDKARIQWRVDLAAAKAALNRKRGERMKALYQKMVDVCGRVAHDNGFDMILFQEPEPDYKNFRSVGDLAGSRMVLRSNESVDLTEQVIRLLNREFVTDNAGE